MSIVRTLLGGANQLESLSIDPEKTVLEALERMKENKSASLIVVYAGEPAGILTERDYAWKVELKGRTAKGTLVKEIMTPRNELVTVTPGATLEECMSLMTEHHVRHMPVMDKGELIGLIAIEDVVAGIARHYEFLLEEAKSYISRPG